jgi:hypothetical protein
MEARSRGEIPFVQANSARYLGHGGEHDVELSEDGLRIIKHTRNGCFGYSPALTAQGRIEGIPATAHEYVERMDANADHFGIITKFEGIHAEHGGGFTVSQPFLSESHPGSDEAREYMLAAGFKKACSAPPRGITPALGISPTMPSQRTSERPHKGKSSPSTFR